ncbi:MAG TPA: tyrosine-type recombinase/integrase [Saprospiraceae bacterium]|nr:tyrosine-type recombinase/integrase [Saprospiraceae bacterium]
MIKWLDGFIRYLSEQKRYSEHTRNAYQLDLTELSNFLNEQYEVDNPGQVTQDQLRDWQMHLKEKNLQSSSISRKISAARSFFSFLEKNEQIKINPSIHLMAPRKESPLPHTISKNRLIDTLRNLSVQTGFPEQRDYICVLLLYACGLRRAELIKLELKDVDSNTSFLRVLGKGNKERLIPLEEKLAKALLRYIKLRTDTFSNSMTQRLILTDKGRPVYDKFVYRLVRKYFNDGQHGKAHPHLIRHSFATHLLENGAKIEYVRKLLGHGSLAATQVYTHLNLTQMQRIYADTHPRKDLLTKKNKE